jgi:hypothetical protein
MALPAFHMRGKTVCGYDGLRAAPCQCLPCRPLSPSGRNLLNTALEVVSDALGSLSKAIASMRQVQSTLGCSTDSYSYRGKVRSMQDASATLVCHLELLLTDLGTDLGRRSTEEVSGVMLEVMEHSKVGSRGEPGVVGGWGCTVRCHPHMGHLLKQLA